MTHSRTPSAAVTSFVVGSRYMPVYLALILLVVVASIWAPATLSSAGLDAIAPMGTFLAITALGQMLVIMTGGIDLSVPGTFLLGGMLMVGVGQQSDERIWIAYLTAIGAAAVIGLFNGILIGGLKLNPLIVTLAVGQIVLGIASRYYSTVAIQKPVPPGLSDWANSNFLGVTRLFWVGVALTVLLVIIFRFTAVGRRFQVVGANPVASTVMGLRVNVTQIAHLRRGRHPLRHGRRPLGGFPPGARGDRRRALPARPDSRRRHRRRFTDRRSSQPDLDFRRRVLPGRAQSDDAGAEPSRPLSSSWCSDWSSWVGCWFPGTGSSREWKGFCATARRPQPSGADTLVAGGEP